MFAGFDRSDPFAEQRLRLLWAATNFTWLGFYISHSHNPQPPSTSWSKPRLNSARPSSRWEWLRDEAWGLAPIYLGRQQETFAPNRELGASQSDIAQRIQFQQFGIDDARIASNLAEAAHIESNATVFIDCETAGFVQLDRAHIPRDTPSFNYLRAWLGAIITFGYRPGVYCSFVDADAIAAVFPEAAIWPFDISRLAVTLFDPTNPSLGNRFLDGPNPFDGRAQTVVAGFGTLRPTDFAVQFDQIHDDQVFDGVHTGQRRAAGLPLTSLTISDPAHPANPFNTGSIDLNWARLPDPSHPERIGAVAACSAPTSREAIVAFVMTDLLAISQRSSAGTWQPNLTKVSDPSTAMVSVVNAYGGEALFDPTAVDASYLTGGTPMLVARGLDGSIIGVEKAAQTWTMNKLLAAPTTGQSSIRKTSPLILTSRAAGVTDAFFVNSSNEVATVYRASRGGAWVVEPVVHGRSAAPASAVAVVSPSQNELCVFFVDWDDSSLWWLRWTPTTSWRQMKVVMDLYPNLRWRAATGLGVVMYRREVHLLAFDNDQIWDLHRDSTPTAAEVASQQSHWKGNSLLGVTQVPLEGRPPVKIRLDTCGPTTLIATLVAASGHVLCSQWSGEGGFISTKNTLDLISTCGALATAPDVLAGFLDIFTLDINGAIAMIRFNTLTRRFERKTIISRP